MRQQLRMEIKRLHNEIESTTIYVTRQLEAMSLADHIAIMDLGVYSSSVHQARPMTILPMNL